MPLEAYSTAILFGETDNGVLGDDVGGEPVEADLAQNAGHVDDGPSAVLQHGADLGPGAEEHPVQIDRQGPSPQLVRDIGKRCHGWSDAGIIAGEVKGAERVHGKADQRVAVFGGASVRVEIRRSPALVGDQVDGLLALGVVDVRDDDRRPGARITGGDGTAQSGGSAGDDGHSSV